MASQEEEEFPTELQSKTFEILSSNDTAQIETLFTNLFSPEPEPKAQQQQQHQSEEALTFLHCSKKHHPDLLFIKLFFLLRCSTSPLTRSHSARALHLLNPQQLWPKLKPIAQARLKAHFLAYLQEETSLHVLRLVSLVLAETVSVIYNNQQQHWPEILDFLVSFTASNDDASRETALLVFASLPNDCRSRVTDALRCAAHVLRASLLESLASSNPDVQAASFGAAVSLVRLFSDPRVFHELLRAMMVAVFALLHGSDGSYFRRATAEMAKLVTEEPALLRPYTSDMVLDVLQIAESDVGGLSRETQRAAFELVAAMTEVKECAVVVASLHQQTLVRVFAIPMKMLLCIEEEEEEDDDKKVGSDRGGYYKLGMKWLDRLFATVGGNKAASVAFELLPQYLDLPEWKKRHAGITMLNVIAKDFSDEMVLMDNFLGEMVPKVLKSFQDSHVRVRLAAFSFMQMPTNFVQVMHILYHRRLMHAFASSLDNEQNYKVKEKVASAMLFFLKNTLPESLTFYKNADAIMRKLLSMLQPVECKDQGEWKIHYTR